MSAPKWILFAGLLLAVTTAHAQEDAKGDARAHFEAGLTLFKAEKYEAAALELEMSVKLYPTRGGLFNLANVYKVLSRYDDALDAVQRLEAEYGDKIEAEMRTAIDKMKAEILGLSARLRIEVSADGAAVFVDGRRVGTSPLMKPVLVDPGEHAVRATLEGYAQAESSVQVVSKQDAQVSLDLQHAKAAPDEAPRLAAGSSAENTAGSRPQDDGAERDRKKLSPVWFWSGLGATVAFGGVALGMDLAVRAKKDELKTNADLDAAERMQKAGIAFACLAGAAAVTTAVLAVFTDFKGQDEAPPVTVGIAPTGAVLEGRF
jgi:tetratricopeptide (TPR) repeat protein